MDCPECGAFIQLTVENQIPEHVRLRGGWHNQRCKASGALLQMNQGNNMPRNESCLADLQKVQQGRADYRSVLIWMENQDGTNTIALAKLIALLLKQGTIQPDDAYELLP